MRTRWIARARPLMTLVLAVCLALGPGLAAPAGAQEQGRGSIHGSVYQVDGKTKLASAKVTVINVRTGKQYPSEVTGENGSYDINGLPAGTYDLVIESGGQLYVADNLVDLANGQSVSLSYAVNPLRPANRNIAGMPPTKGSASLVGLFRGDEAVMARNFWASPGGIILIAVLGGGAAVAISNNNNNNNASPSTP
jgi:Carboxypeptidase regulatory-like domain